MEMTTKNPKMACLFGGTGFIGRQITRLLAKHGYLVKVATRVPERAYFLKTAGNVGQIVPFACDYKNDQNLREAVSGCDLVINCIGILYQRKKNGFAAIHTELPRAIAKACKAENVGRFVHISALGCDHTDSKYGKSKYAGEQAVHENYPTATIVRPSVVFGVEDSFLNKFAKMSVVMPFLPLIGGGMTKFQPVYVGDVAQAVLACAENPQTAGRTYELGGPEILTFREILTRLGEETGRKKCLVSLPWPVAYLKGCVLGLLPAPLLTADQVVSLKTDNTVARDALTLADLGIAATRMDSVVPGYLARYRPGGRFGNKKRA